MSPLDLAFLFFMVSVLIKIVIEFDKHMGISLFQEISEIFRKPS